MFMVVESHYVRKTSKAQYLPQELSLAEMYRLYQNWCHENKYRCENYDFYRRVFSTRFNLKFQCLKKDLCSTCSAFKHKPDKTDSDKEEHADHLKRKEQARNLKQKAKEKAKNEKDTVAAAFDLEQVLLSPYGQTSDFYYSRRLKNHNFTITEIDNMNTCCYLWHEGECNKGSCEIATSLYEFVKRKKDASRFFFFSDASGGQNRNRFVLVMFSLAVKTFGLDFIDITFLVSGHSQNENDTANLTIEKNYHQKTIFTPAQWETVIHYAFKKNTCQLKVLTHKDVINFKSCDAFPEYAEVQ